MELVAFPCGYLAEAKSVNASDPYDSVSAFFFCAAACHFSGELPISGTFPRKVHLCSQVQINGRFRGLVSRQKIRRSIWPWILNILLFLQRLHLNILPVVTQTAPLCQSYPCLLRFSIPPKYKSGRSHPWLRPVWLQRMLSSAFTSQPGRLQRRGAGSVCRDPEPHRAAHW